MASRIALYEADVSADFIEVDPKTKRTMTGVDYLTVNPLGLVPALRTDDGDLLLENAAILQYIAGRYPSAALAPADGFERARLQQWLSFIGTELHKALFVPLFDKALPDAAQSKTRQTGARRLDYLDRHLQGRAFLLEQFSVADAYLVTVLNWSNATAVDLQRWPALKDYFDRIRSRPAVARAMREEFGLYAEEQKRHQAA
jgi:glutathione S-transferase